MAASSFVSAPGTAPGATEPLDLFCNRIQGLPLLGQEQALKARIEALFAEKTQLRRCLDQLALKKLPLDQIIRPLSERLTIPPSTSTDPHRIKKILRQRKRNIKSEIGTLSTKVHQVEDERLITTSPEVIDHLQLEPLFFRAIHSKRMDLAEKIVDINAKSSMPIDLLNQKDRNGMRPLDHAIYENDVTLANWMLHRGANPNSPDPVAISPLNFAISNASLDMVDLLVRNGAEVNNWANPPLLRAVREGKIDCVRYLLQHGANPSPGGNSALCLAAELPTPEIAELLVQNGASINKKNLDGRRPLAHAILKGSQPLIQRLLQHGADAGSAQSCLNLKAANLIWTLGCGDITEHASLFLEYCTRFFQSPSFSPDGSPPIPLSEDELVTIQETLQHMISSDLPLNQETVHRFKEGRPTLLLKTVMNGHHMISLLIHKNRLMICNRGTGATFHTIEVYNIRADLADESFLKFLTICKELLHLHFCLDEVFPKLTDDGINQKLQKVGNCTWANAESGLLALLYSVFLEKGTSPKESEARARAIYKQFTTFARIHSLDEYLSSCTRPKLKFLMGVRAKILEKPTRFDPETRRQLLKKIGDEISKRIAT